MGKTNRMSQLGNESESDSGWVLLYKLTLQKYGTLQNKQSTQSSVATLKDSPNHAEKHAKLIR